MKTFNAALLYSAAALASTLAMPVTDSLAAQAGSTPAIQCWCVGSEQPGSQYLNNNPFTVYCQYSVLLGRVNGSEEGSGLNFPTMPWNPPAEAQCASWAQQCQSYLINLDPIQLNPWGCQEVIPVPLS